MRGVRARKGNPAPALESSAGYSALKIVELATDNKAARLIQRLQNYAIYFPNTPTLRGTAQDTQSRDPLGLSGGRLAEGYAEFRKNILDNDEALQDSVLELVDWVADIDTTDAAGSLLSPSVPRSKYVLRFTDRFMKKSRNQLTAYDASEGALYVLFCAILCLSPNAPKLLAVDNIDQALNPRLVARLMAKLSPWLKQADSERQLLFTAHNPAVLDGLDLTDDEVRLFAVERNSNGYTDIKPIKPTTELLALNEEYPLSPGCGRWPRLSVKTARFIL